MATSWFRCRAFVVHVRVRAVQQYTLETKYTQNVFVIIIIIIIILFAQYYKQYAHLRQYNLEEQDSKVRQEH